MQNMNVQQFSAYVIENMHRATLANALNIADKLDNADFYQFTDFTKSIVEYVSNPDIARRIGNVKMCRIIALIYDVTKKYSSDIKYNKRMLIDSFIISLWQILSEV